MDIDDIPVGKGPAVPSGMAEEAEGEEECFDSVPIPKLLGDTNWKCRRAALERVANHPKDDSNLSDFFNGLSKLFKESNSSVQEALFDAALVVWDVASESEKGYLAEGMCKLMIEKGITGRPKAASSSNLFLQALVATGRASIVGDTLLAAFVHKTPKNRQFAAASFAVLVEANGLQGFPSIKALMKAVAPLCNDTNGQVRKEALNFIVQCQVHSGPSITTFLSEHLRDVQLQELDKLFQENVPVSKRVGAGAAASRGPTSSSAFAEEGGDAGSTGGRTNILPPPAIDPAVFNELDESPVITALPKNFYKIALDKTGKWQDRNRIIQEGLLPLLHQPRLRASDDYMDLVKCLRDLLNDPQMPLNTTAFKAVQDLARGLRETLSGNYMRYLIPAVFEKFKDKKTSVIESVYTTLGLFLGNGCCSFESLQEEIDGALSSKIPHQRTAMVTWLNLIVPNINEAVLKARLCRSPHLRKLLADDKVEVRDGTLTLIGRLIAVCGNEPCADILSTLDSKQMSKVQCGSDPNFNPGNPLPSGAHSSHPPSPSKGAGGTTAPLSAGRRASAVGGAAERPTGGSAPGKRSTSSVNTSKAGGSSGHAESQVDANDAVSFESSLPSKVDALSKVESSLRPDAPTTLLADLSSKEWKKRQDAVLALQDHITDDVWSSDVCSNVLEPLVVLLGHTPGWKESIFQVATAMIALLASVAERADVLSTRSAFALINGVALKLSDMKCRDPTKELLTIVSQGVGPKFVTKYLLEASGKIKQPKQLTEALAWVERSLEEFTACAIDAKAIVNFVKLNCFSSQPPAIKTAGVNLVAALRVRVGPKLEPFYEDINPHIKAAVADEYNSRSMKMEEYPIPQRQLKPTCKLEAAAAAPTSSSIARKVSPALHGGGAAAARHSDPTASAVRTSGRSPIPVRHGAAPTTAAGGVRGSAPTRAAPVAQVVVAEPEPYAAEVEDGGDLPRTDVGPQLHILSKDIANGADWKARLASVKKVDALCNKYHKHIGVGGVSETLKALTSRFQEPNKNFVVDVLRTMSLLVSSAPEDGVRGAVKASLPTVMGFLGDQKQPLREEAANYAQMGFLLLGLESILPLVQKPITADAMFAQSAILDLLEAAFEQHIQSLEQSNSPPRIVPPRLIIPLISPILKLGMGRHGDVRVKAEQVLVYVLNMVGEDAVHKEWMDLRPAEQQSVKAMVERAMEASNPPPPPGHQQQHAAVEEERVVTNPHRMAPHHYRADEEDVEDVPRYVPPTHHPIQVAQPHVINHVHHDPYVPPVATRPVVADLADVLDGIRTSAPEEVLMLCGDFRAMFATDKTIGRAETIEACGERLRSTLCNPRAANMSPASREMCAALVAILSSIISADVCAAILGEGLLREIYSLIVDALMTEPPTAIVRALNEFALAAVVKCPVDAGFQALLGCLNDYTVEYLNDPTSIRHRYTTLIVKCIMRLETKRVSPEVLVEACYDFLVDHPLAVFKGKDDLPLRTIKMSIGNLYKVYKEELIKVAERQLRGKTADGGAVLSYIRGFESGASPQRAPVAAHAQDVPPTSNALSASLPPQPLTRSTPPPQQQASHTAAPANLGGNSTSYAEEASPVRTRVTAGPADASAAPHPHYPTPSTTAHAEEDEDGVLAEMDRMEEIFLRARKPETSPDGVKDMYRMLKPGIIQTNAALTVKFEECYNVCTPAFKGFLARRMFKLFNEDPAKVTGFTFPKIIIANKDV